MWIVAWTERINHEQRGERTNVSYEDHYEVLTEQESIDRYKELVDKEPWLTAKATDESPHTIERSIYTAKRCCIVDCTEDHQSVSSL